MKTVILCGGRGSRMGEATTLRPKPMLNIGDHPIIWHILNIYSSQGFNDFVLALGYQGQVLKDYFEQLNHPAWKITAIDTGIETQAGGRLLPLAPILGDEPFMLTYGDGVANVDLNALLAFHQNHGKRASVTAVRPPARFGSLEFTESGKVTRFSEKPQTGEGWINGGFFVFNPEVLKYVSDASTMLEREVLEKLTTDDQLRAYQHQDYWQCMDTIRDKEILEEQWRSGNAPWKTWE